jgi:hypothetical protein
MREDFLNLSLFQRAININYRYDIPINMVSNYLKKITNYLDKK